MPRWRFALQQRNGATLSKFTEAYDREFDYARNAPYAFDCRLDHESPDAYKLLEYIEQGVPVLRAWRVEDGADPATRPATRYAGILTSIDEDSDSGMRLKFETPLAWLIYRLTAEIKDFPGIDQGAILAELVNDTQAVSSAGIVLGNIAATVARDLTFEHSVVADAIRSLTDVDNGIELEQVPLDDTNGASLMRLDVLAASGVERPAAKFGYGPGTVGNVAHVGRKWLPPRNGVRVLGAEGVYTERQDATSIGAYGLWQTTETMPDTIELDLLDARGFELLAPRWRRTVTFEPDPLKTHPRTGEALTPQPGRDYWLGDRVPLVVREGALRIDEFVRVDGIKIGLNDNGDEERHELVIPETQ